MSEIVGTLAMLGVWFVGSIAWMIAAGMIRDWRSRR